MHSLLQERFALTIPLKPSLRMYWLLRIIQLFSLIFICISCSDNERRFTECDTISDRFLETYPDWHGCLQSSDYLSDFMKTNRLSSRRMDGNSYNVPSRYRDMIPTSPSPTRAILVYGKLVKSKRRKENYVAFISTDGQIIAILPRYSYY